MVFRFLIKASTPPQGYTHAVGGTIRRAGVALVVYAGLLFLTWAALKLCRGFIPTQDSGYLNRLRATPDGASLERSQKISAAPPKLPRDSWR